MSRTRLGLLRLVPLVLLPSGLAAGMTVAQALEVPEVLGISVGVGLGFAVSTVVLRRGYASG